MSVRISVRPVPENAYDIWNRVVVSSRHGSIYSTPEYLDVLCSVTGARFSILGAYKGDELLGGVGLYLTKCSSGTIASSRLLLYYNGLVVGDHVTNYPSLRTARHLEILTALEENLSAAGYARVRIHNRHTLTDVRPFITRGWCARPGYSYEVPVDDLKTQWDRVEQNLRRLINRCASLGTIVTDEDGFDDFYRLHAQTHERKGAPLYLSREAFREYFDRLKRQNLARLYCARDQEGRALAAQLVLLGGHPVTHTVSAAADAEFLNTGATPFLRWKAFEALNALGYQANDLTDAALNPVTHFKSQLGGNLCQTMILTRPDSRLLRAQDRIDALYRGGRGLIGRLVKPVKSGGEE